MRLFHVSEEENIEVFHPRIPKRKDIKTQEGLVWAVDDKRLPNFLTPRNCPRVTYHINSMTTDLDIKKFISSDYTSHVLVIENKWFETMKNTLLYIYEFDITNFVLQDEIAGYYVSKISQKPIAKYKIVDLFAELFKRNVEVRIVDNLWNMFDVITKSTFNYSMCRMGFAQPRRSEIR